MEQKKEKNAVFLYNVTSAMVDPWLEAGYVCWSFDAQHDKGVTVEGNLRKVGMWFQSHAVLSMAMRIVEIVGHASFVFGFPECTDLTSAGSKHWGKKIEFNPLFWEEAIALADLVRVVGNLFNCPWGFENPKGRLATLYRKPDYRFDPTDYAGYLPEDDVHPLYPDIYPPQDRYNKESYVWGGNGFKMPKKKRLEPFEKANPGWKKCGGKSLKTKNIRSSTPRGFSRATFIANGVRLNA